MHRKLQRAAAIVIGVVASAAGPAQAGVRQDFSLGFTTSRPVSDTGISLHLLYKNPSNPNAKPPALTSLVIELPTGTTFRTGAVTACSASDAQLQLEGPGACRDESHLATGKFTAMTGIAPLDPFVAWDEVFNGGGALIEDVVFPGTQLTAGVDRLRIQGSTLTASPPHTPGGPPDGRTVPREIEFSIPAYGPFIQTPSTCSAAGEWTATSTATFDDGGSETDTSSVPCLHQRTSARWAIERSRIRSRTQHLT